MTQKGSYHHPRKNATTLLAKVYMVKELKCYYVFRLECRKDYWLSQLWNFEEILLFHGTTEYEEIKSTKHKE